MILWYDDVRPPIHIDAVFWARTNKTAQWFVEHNDRNISHAFLDHDMGMHTVHPEEAEAFTHLVRGPWHNGLHLVEWLIRHGYLRKSVITIHSWNPDGAKRMKQALIAANYENVYYAPFNEEWYGKDFLLPQLRA